MSKRIMIDPGHAPGNANGGKNGYKEYAGMMKLSGFLKAALERCGCTANLTRAETENPSLSVRGGSAKGHDLFVSEHSNAATGIARGVEAYYSVKLPGDKAFAEAMTKAVSEIMGNPNRGAKTRVSTNDAKSDYYTVMYTAQAVGAAHVLLIENGFHDNEADEAFLLKDDNLRRIAEVQAQVICSNLGCTYISDEETRCTPIIGTPTATPEQMVKWAEGKSATVTFINLAEMFYRKSVAAGINPAVTYCQSAKETAYGRFGGVLDESYCNPCGMKTAQGGGDYDSEAHKKFANWDEGIQAQIDHLALYAGAAGYPKKDSPDPRHFPYLYGSAKTVEQLGGKWAASTEYGNDIVKMMKAVEAIEIPAGKPENCDDSIITVIIGGEISSIPAENIGGFWYIVIGGSKIKLRDIFNALGYGVIWDETSRAVIAFK